MESSQEKEAKSKIEKWVKRFDESGMPVLAHTSNKLSDMAKEDAASAAEFSAVILRDPTMTAKILRMANSAKFNPSGKRINTISNAVVVLGVETLRGMCLSVSMIDNLLKGNPRERLMKEVARSFHAAVQAERMAQAMGDPNSEDAFVAALLYHVGDLGFWCFGGKHADELDEALTNSSDDPAEVQKRVLGFELNELTRGVSTQWQLNETLMDSLSCKSTPLSRSVQLAHAFTEAVEKGWKNKKLKSIIAKIAEHTNQNIKSAEEFVELGAADAISQMRTYKAAAVAELIPMPANVDADLSEQVLEELDLAKAPKNDPILQLHISREISSLKLDGSNVNLLLQMVLEGLHRGVGLDRVLVAFFTPNKHRVRSKFGLEYQDTGLLNRFDFPSVNVDTDLFAQVMETHECMRIDTDMIHIRDSQMNGIVGDQPFFTGPITIGNRDIGVFYADRQISGRALEEECFQGFQHFVQQANLCLDLISNK